MYTTFGEPSPSLHIQCHLSSHHYHHYHLGQSKRLHYKPYHQTFLHPLRNLRLRSMDSWLTSLGPSLLPHLHLPGTQLSRPATRYLMLLRQCAGAGRPLHFLGKHLPPLAQEKRKHQISRIPQFSVLTLNLLLVIVPGAVFRDISRVQVARLT